MDSKIVLLPPDTEGMLAAAALLRSVGVDQDVQALLPHEITRRIYGLSTEPDARQVIVMDLVPLDSLETLLQPALERLAQAGTPVIWYYGRAGSAPLLQALAGAVTLHYEEGAGTWRLVCEGDEPFTATAARIADAHDREEDAAPARWRLLLEALSTSWDWARLYSCLRRLARLEDPTEEDLAWAREQHAELECARALVSRAPIRLVQTARLVVLEDPTIPARVRLDIFWGQRPDVDALAFVAGPGRLRMVAAHPDGDLSFLQQVPGLLSDLEGGVRSPAASRGRTPS